MGKSTTRASRLRKVNRQVMTLSVPAQDCISKDNVSVRVDAVVYFRVVDAVKATVNVQNYQFAISQLAQTSLRSVIGKAELDELLSNRGSSVPSSPRSSTHRPSSRGVSRSNGSKSRTSPCLRR